jgi:transposase
MNLHLAEISVTVALGAHAVLIIDCAGWLQAGSRLIVPPDITSLRLPLCRPELNPVENIRDYLRPNKLSNHLFDTHDQIVDACCDP